MKITDGRFEYTIKQAVEDAATPSAYSYEGQLEKLETKNDKLCELVARLIETMFETMFDDRYRNDKEKLEYILGYGYEVKE